MIIEFFRLIAAMIITAIRHLIDEETNTLIDAFMNVEFD